ncbi:hypothetical protein EPA93_14195 [Ktedonosporobacter rubrisoli]|uniref:Uncharacterized protein n=1 Tax=Ktedonosporobacter rubrisoli TaxID=2509675 RepID=A0A4P6JPS4_KTERU|nr:hypothetical protein [Ktedonosporobacter rubrisoli]QBD77092.1 hypothetical protein EPA93_14195 [Ktedonosporobacter rubrisoli]
MWAELQTIQMTYAQILQGERPWNALGDFLNYWFDYASDRRQEMVEDALVLPGTLTDETLRWAAFCSASVEYLCACYGLTCPAWVHDPAYVLPEPWFHGLGAQRPHVQMRLLHETPEAFSRRKIYCSPRLFANKYELASEKRERQVASV